MELVLATEEPPRDEPRSAGAARCEERDGDAPAGCSAGSWPGAPAAETQAAGQEGCSAIFADRSLVQIHGIEKKPELNEKIGVVLSFDGGADRRYTVKVSGSSVRLREDKLKVAPEGWEATEDNDVIPLLSDEERAARAMEQARVKKAAAAKALTDAGRDEKKLSKAIEHAKTWNIDVQEAEAVLTEVQEERAREQARLEEAARARDAANIEFIKGLPQGEMTAAGRLVPTYSWVQVPPHATLPQGMEIWLLGGFKCARIPASWRLQIVAEGQLDSYRVDVGEGTLVSDVLAGAASRFGWAAEDLQLLQDGKIADCDAKTTVGSSGLFGAKLTARKLF